MKTSQENKNQLLLTSVYQNTQTALQSIDNILPSTKQNELVSELAKQASEYKAIATECEEYAKAEELELSSNSFFEKIRLWSSIKMSTLTDKSTRHITEMMLFGTFMGIVQCIKDFSDYTGCNKEIIEFLNKLQILEEANLETLKKFL